MAQMIYTYESDCRCVAQIQQFTSCSFYSNITSKQKGSEMFRIFKVRNLKEILTVWQYYSFKVFKIESVIILRFKYQLVDHTLLFVRENLVGNVPRRPLEK